MNTCEGSGYAGRIQYFGNRSYSVTYLQHGTCFICGGLTFDKCGVASSKISRTTARL